MGAYLRVGACPRHYGIRNVITWYYLYTYLPTNSTLSPPTCMSIEEGINLVRYTWHRLSIASSGLYNENESGTCMTTPKLLKRGVHYTCAYLY